MIKPSKRSSKKSILTLASKELKKSNILMDRERTRAFGTKLSAEIIDDIRSRNNKTIEHLGLAHLAAKKQFARGAGEFDDLLQEARLGLLLAIDNFEPGLGYRISSYAMARARGQILHFRRDRLNTIRIPWRLKDLYSRGMRIQESLLQQGKTKLRDDELARILGVSHNRWKESIYANWQTNTISLNLKAKLHNDYCHETSESLLDQISITKPSEDDLQLIWLKSALKRLKSNQRRWLKLFYFENNSIKEIAIKEKMNESVIRREIKSTLNKLKSLAKSHQNEINNPE